MPEPVFRPDGSVVADTDLARAIETGEARFDSARTYAVNVGGVRRAVPGSEVWSALQQGGQLETADEARIREMEESPLEAVKAFGEGAASSASFGATDVIGRAIGGKEYAKKAALRKEAHGGSRFAGELVGMVPGLLESGGGSLAGKAVRAAGAPARAVSQGARIGGEGIAKVLGGGRIARGIGAVATGGLEGAVYAAGQEASDAAIRDKELSAEAVLMGGVMGGAIGGGVAGVLGLGRSAVGKVAGTDLKGLSRQAAARAMHPKITDLRRLGRDAGGVETRLEDMGEELLTHGMLGPKGLASPAEIELRANTRLKEVGAEIGSLRKRVDETIARWHKGSRSQGIEPPVDVRGHIQSFFRSVDDDILHPLQQSDSPIARRDAKKIETHLESLRDDFVKEKNISTERLRKFQKDLAELYPKSPMPGVAPPVTGFDEKLRGVERKLDKTLDNITADVVKITGGPEAALPRLEKSYSVLKDIKGAAGRSAVHDIGNATFSPTAKAMGIATALATGGLSVGSVLTGAATGLATKAVQAKAPGVIAVAADSVVSRMASRAQEARIRLGSEVSRGIRPIKTSQKVASVATKAALAYSQTVKHVNDNASYEESTAKKIEPLAAVAPKTAARASAVLAGDRMYLRGLLPPASKPLVAGKDSALPARSAIAALNRAAMAIEDPMEVAKAVRNNDLSPDMAAAIRERRPELLDVMRQAAFDTISDLAKDGKVPDHQSRITLSVLFDAPVEPLMEPARLKNLQQVHKARYEEPSLAPAPGPTGSAGKKSQRTQTDTERLAGANS